MDAHVDRLPGALLFGLICLACDGGPPATSVPGTVGIAAGTFQLGSDSAERAVGYELSPPAVRQAGWYDAWERDSYTQDLGPFLIDSTPVTQGAYADFVTATGHRSPRISEQEYVQQGFLVHSYDEVREFLWNAGAPDSTIQDHPVVLVSRDDAVAYCEWRGGRLPTEYQWEAVCRGTDHRTFPWGDGWRNGISHVKETFTAPVTAHPAAATPDGVLDLAGNVFEWTSSDFGADRVALKGCSWDDAPGTCRCAFRHGRPANSRHILIGFRCAYDVP